MFGWLKVSKFAEQRVGVRMAGVVRIVGVVAEVDAASNRRRPDPCGCAGCRSRPSIVCEPHDLADVVINVERRVGVLVGELAVAGRVPAKFWFGDAAES